jgi:hypothetical protein
MFPNIRLMIAAMVASMVALSCGFGVFAAFRVNHEPLVRLPPVTAPLQLIAGNSAAVAVAAAEPFDRRFQTSPPQSAARATEPPTLRRDDREGVESAPAASAAVPDRGAAEAEEPAAAVPATEPAVGPAAPAVPTVLPTAATMANTVAPTADNHPLGATAPEPAPAAHADAASSSQETPAVAVIESPTADQGPQVEQKPEREVAPASIAKAVEEVAHKPDRKAAVSRAKRRRVIAWAYRAHGSRANAVGQFDSQYLKQDTAFSQPNFQTASQTSHLGLTQRHRSKDNSRPPEDATAVAGGPFVNPPGR